MGGGRGRLEACGLERVRSLDRRRYGAGAPKRAAKASRISAAAKASRATAKGAKRASAEAAASAAAKAGCAGLWLRLRCAALCVAIAQTRGVKPHCLS